MIYLSDLFLTKGNGYTVTLFNLNFKIMKVFVVTEVVPNKDGVNTNHVESVYDNKEKAELKCMEIAEKVAKENNDGVMYKRFKREHIFIALGIGDKYYPISFVKRFNLK
jgi:hypothetical protein